MTEQLRIAKQMLNRTNEWRQNRRTTIDRLNGIATNGKIWHNFSLAAKVVSAVSNGVAGGAMIGVGLDRLNPDETFNDGGTYWLEDLAIELGVRALVVDLLATLFSTFVTWIKAYPINSNVIPMLKEDKKHTKYLGSLITTLHHVCQEQITSDTAVGNMSSQQLMSKYLIQAMGKSSSSRSDRKPFGFSCLKGDSCGAVDVTMACAQTGREAEYRSLDKYFSLLIIRLVGSVASKKAYHIAYHIASYSKWKATKNIIFTAVVTTIGALTLGFGLIQLRNALSQTHCIGDSELRSAASKLQDQLDEVEADMEEYENSPNIE